MLNRFKNAEWVKVFKGALIVASGAGLTHLFEWASTTDLGTFTPVVVAFLSVLINAIRKVATAPA